MFCRCPVFLPSLFTALAFGAAASGAAAADVGVSITIAEPGVYGRIDIGRFPQPMVVLERPRLVVLPDRVRRPPEPVYLWVPPGHRRHWDRHCHRYDACGVPVYFVDDGWYRRHVLADDRQGRGHGRGRGHDRDR